MAHRYGSTMTRLEQITEAGYKVQVMWECEFDTIILVHHPELQLQPIVEHSPLNNRDALHGVRTEAMWFHYKISRERLYATSM
jgi:G:T-mismatch repair DNA endonuclease (very short patch repair protein)